MILYIVASVLASLGAAAAMEHQVIIEGVRTGAIGRTSCKSLASGTLVMKSLPLATSTLPTEGVSLAVIDKVLQEDYACEEKKFVFQSCKSSFINVTSSIEGDAAVHYGHIYLAENPAYCLSVHTGQTNEQRIGIMLCNVSDDSSQMSQFWKITLNTADPTALAPVEFVGKSTRLLNTHYYTTDFVNELDGSNVAKITFVNGLNQPTFYEINLVSN